LDLSPDVWPEQGVKTIREGIAARWQIIVPLGAGCGLRQGEILGLSPDDIDDDGLVLPVRRAVQP
jgi:integrase